MDDDDDDVVVVRDSFSSDDESQTPFETEEALNEFSHRDEEESDDDLQEETGLNFDDYHESLPVPDDDDDSDDNFQTPLATKAFPVTKKVPTALQSVLDDEDDAFLFTGNESRTHYGHTTFPPPRTGKGNL